MSKKFYLIYQLVLIAVTLVAIGLGIYCVLKNTGNAITGMIWNQPEIIACISIFGAIIIGYIVFILLTYVKGEKIS